MTSSKLWEVLHRELEAIRSEYVASGRGEDFDRYVAGLKAADRWPFDR